jgi:hypothetical protein
MLLSSTALLFKLHEASMDFLSVAAPFVQDFEVALSSWAGGASSFSGLRPEQHDDLRMTIELFCAAASSTDMSTRLSHSTLAFLATGMLLSE